MKKSLFAAAALGLTVALAVPALAQFATGAGQARAHRGAGLKKLAASLGLTPDQKAQLKPILRTSRQQAKTIKADSSLTPDAKRTQLKDLRQSRRRQMLAILTPAQREKLKDLRRERQGAKNSL